MIIKITFQCDNCGRKVRIHLPTRSGRVLPKGWYRMELEGLAIDVCSTDCRDEYSQKHVAHTLVPKEGREKKRELRVLVFAGAERRSQAKRDEELSLHLGVPAQLMDEFYEHTIDTACPKCEAAAQENCKIQVGDETFDCPEHGPHLKYLVHRERVQEAHKTWKSKLQ